MIDTNDDCDNTSYVYVCMHLDGMRRMFVDGIQCNEANWN